MNPASLKRRAESLRLGVKDLARMAGVDEMTVHRAFKGDTDPRLSTLTKIEEAIRSEEDRVVQSIAAPEVRP